MHVVGDREAVEYARLDALGEGFRRIMPGEPDVADDALASGLGQRLQRAALLRQKLHLCQAEPPDLVELQIVHTQNLHLQVYLRAVAVGGGLSVDSCLAGDYQTTAAALQPGRGQMLALAGNVPPGCLKIVDSGGDRLVHYLLRQLRVIRIKAHASQRERRNLQSCLPQITILHVCYLAISSRVYRTRLSGHGFAWKAATGQPDLGSDASHCPASSSV